MKLSDALLFANNAQLAAAAGVLCLVLAGLARIAEGRRIKRARIDRVGSAAPPSPPLATAMADSDSRT